MFQYWSKRNPTQKCYLSIIFCSIVHFAILFTVLYYYPGTHYICDTEDCIKASSYILNYLDESQDPCKNFYKFVCGEVSLNPVVNEVLYINKLLRFQIEGPILKNDSHSIKLQKSYFKSCADLEAIESDNNKSILKLFQELGGWPLIVGDKWDGNKFNWVEFVIKCRKLGLDFDWFLDVNVQNDEGKKIITIEAPEAYAKPENIRTRRYANLISDVLKALGVKNDRGADINDLIAFETNLLEIIHEHYGYVVRYKKVKPVKRLTKDEPSIDWINFLGNITNRPVSKEEHVWEKLQSYLFKLRIALDNTDTRTQTNYIMWKIFEGFVPFLTENIRALFGRNETKDDRINYCYERTRTLFQFVSEGDYVRKLAKNNDNIKNIFQDIKSILKNRLVNIKWLDNTARKIALTKLNDLRTIFGGSYIVMEEKQLNSLNGIHGVEFKDNNIINMERALFIKNLDHLYNLDNNVDLKEIKYFNLVYPVEAQYNFDSNTLFLPASIFGGIFNSKNRPNYLNYGTAGTIIGHELSHAFGIKGSIYSINNSTINWWTNDVLNDFLKASECLLNCTNIYENVEPAVCNRTFDENFADLTGINLAYAAYQKWVEENGKEPWLPVLKYNPNQLFWISYTKTMCTSQFPPNVNQKFNHLLFEHKVLASLKNSKYFANDFSCPINSLMNPKEKCEIL